MLGAGDTVHWRFGERSPFDVWVWGGGIGLGYWLSAEKDSGSRERLRPFIAGESAAGVERDEVISEVERGLLWKRRVGSLGSASLMVKSG